MSSAEFQITWAGHKELDDFIIWETAHTGIHINLLVMAKPDCILPHHYLVFGLGRIFRLERSAIFMTEFWARLELGAINFHLKPCMFTWAKIGSPFEVIILALYSNIASYHLISTRFLITTSFMISIKWPVDYPIYTNFNEPSHLPCPTSNIGLRTSRQCLPPCGG